ncbi:MAG: SCO family protein [Myxococcota bacterium]|nr:SCO family protein [Myxococcota bacterium]
MDAPSPASAPRSRPPPFKKPWFWLLLIGALASTGVLIRGVTDRMLRPPPVLVTLPAFAFTNQRGEPFGSQQLEGKVWIANFIFTRCPSICPRFTGEMRRVQEKTQATKPPIQLVSFSVDPAYDQPPVLAEYAQRHQADPRRWSFLTGAPEQVKGTVMEGFKVVLGGGDGGADDPDNIFHGTHFVLVDDALQVRGYYRSDDPVAVKNLIRDARILSRRR